MALKWVMMEMVHRAHRVLCGTIFSLVPCWKTPPLFLSGIIS
jgi:hypothetical protein